MSCSRSASNIPRTAGEYNRLINLQFWRNRKKTPEISFASQKKHAKMYSCILDPCFTPKQQNILTPFFQRVMYKKIRKQYCTRANSKPKLRSVIGTVLAHASTNKKCFSKMTVQQFKQAKVIPGSKVASIYLLGYFCARFKLFLKCFCNPLKCAPKSMTTGVHIFYIQSNKRLFSNVYEYASKYRRFFSG